jgi:hypothetical protein
LLELYGNELLFLTISIFKDNKIEDLWILDCCIPLKDKFLVELIRSAICWVLWLTRNKCIFDKALISSVRSLGLQIIHLAKFWCTARNVSQLLNLTLMLLREVGLPLQVGTEELVMVGVDLMVEGLSSTLENDR